MNRNAKLFFEALLSSTLLFLLLFRPLEFLIGIGYIIKNYFNVKSILFPELIYLISLVLIIFIILSVVFPKFRRDHEGEKVWIISSLISSIFVPIIIFMGIYLIQFWRFSTHS